MASNHEREILAEFIDIYKDMPCLWDLSSHSYRDLAKKKRSWEILVDKLKEIDPNANEVSAKRKIDHLKAAYQREFKKVRESKKRGGPAHKPILWYYNLLSFLEKKDESERSRVDSEDEGKLQSGSKRKTAIKERDLQLKKPIKVIDTTQELVQGSQIPNEKKTNSFGIYVGEKLDRIPSGQRAIAEKLISDVIFHAMTNNLDFDSRIENPSKSRCFTPTSSHARCNPSPYFIQVPPSTRMSRSPHSSDESSNLDQSQYIIETHDHKLSYSPIPQIASSPTLDSPIRTLSPSQVQHNPLSPSSRSPPTNSANQPRPTGKILKKMLENRK